VAPRVSAAAGERGGSGPSRERGVGRGVGRGAIGEKPQQYQRDCADTLSALSARAGVAYAPAAQARRTGATSRDAPNRCIGFLAHGRSIRGVGAEA
jgi:hypothetical protein